MNPLRTFLAVLLAVLLQAAQALAALSGGAACAGAPVRVERESCCEAVPEQPPCCCGEVPGQAPEDEDPGPCPCELSPGTPAPPLSLPGEVPVLVAPLLLGHLLAPRQPEPVAWVPPGPRALARGGPPDFVGYTVLRR